MASKSTKILPQTPPTELRISKSEFTGKLEERIYLGNEISAFKVKTQTDFDKNKKDFSHWHDYNLEYLKQVFNNQDNEYKKAYETAGAWSGRRISLGSSSSPDQKLKEFKDMVESKISNLIKLVDKTELLKSSVEESADLVKSIISKESSNSKKIFIVHGHDDLAKIDVARFIEKLGFEAIILHEQVNSGKTIIEKIEEFSNVGFGLVLYTPCDIGYKNGDDKSMLPRARQNVVFEHGYLIAKLGRGNVCALVKGKVEIPNDISGVVYVSMDDHKAWRFEIAKELKNSGYNVDLNLII